MAEKKFRVVHYLNQFFGGIGGEGKTNVTPFAKEGAVGPGNLFQKLFGESAEIITTVICGDNYFSENIEEASRTILDLIKQSNPDIFIAGPAFNAGRYGLACGEICKRVSQTLKIPVVTGMYLENAGLEYRKWVYIVKTKGSAMGMQEAVSLMTKISQKLLKGEALESPEAEGYFPQEIRKNYFAEECGAKRAIDMLLKKIGGETFQTEYKMPVFDRVTPLPPVEDLAKIKVALITSGGIVPKGNPDRIESSSASKFGKYSLEGLEFLSAETHQTAHGGYDPTYANENPNRVLPLDVMRELEKAGIFGKLHPFYYATVGNGTSVANAKTFAQNIVKDLLAEGVGAVIITST